MYSYNTIGEVQVLLFKLGIENNHICHSYTTILIDVLNAYIDFSIIIQRKILILIVYSLLFYAMINYNTVTMLLGDGLNLGHNQSLLLLIKYLMYQHI
jgi:hypothetical protein